MQQGLGAFNAAKQEINLVVRRPSRGQRPPTIRTERHAARCVLSIEDLLCVRRNSSVRTKARRRLLRSGPYRKV